MSARTRACLACDGQGSVVTERPSLEKIQHLGGLQRAIHYFKSAACPACLGSDTQTDPDTLKDALVDAETLRGFMLAADPWSDWAGTWGAAVVEDPSHREAFKPARQAARAAFRAVPALKALALAGALLILPGRAHAGDRAGSYAVWCGTKAADLMSTEVFLSRGYSEANPLLQNRGVRVGVGVGTCALAAEVDHRIRHKRKTRWAFRAAAIVGFSFVVKHNLETDR